MNGPGSDKFFMVAMDKSDAGLPVPFLLNPPKAMQNCEKTAEAEAVRLATKSGEGFYILEATAYVEVVDGVPKWTNL
jgi:hypothetical protein